MDYEYWNIGMKIVKENMFVFFLNLGIMVIGNINELVWDIKWNIINCKEYLRIIV